MNYNPSNIVIPDLPKQIPWWLFKDNPNERLMGKHCAIDERDIDTAKALNEIWWFELHQPLLLEMGNTTAGRELLCIDTNINLPLIELRKNKALFLNGYTNNGSMRLIHQFYIGAKFGNVIRNRWVDFKAMANSFYRIDLGRGHSVLRPVLRHNGQLVAAAATNTFFPDAHVESSTCDGYTQHYHDDGVGDWTHTANTAPNASSHTGYGRATDALINHMYQGANNHERPNIIRGQWHFDTTSIASATFDTSITPTFRRYCTSTYMSSYFTNTTYMKSILVPNSTSSTTDVAFADYLLGATANDAEYDAGDTAGSVRARSETNSAGVGRYEIDISNQDNLKDLFDGSFPTIFRMSAIEANFDRPIRQGGTTAPSIYSDSYDSLIAMASRAADYTGTDDDPRLTIGTVDPSNIHAMNAVTLTNIQALNGITAANGEAISGITF